MGIWQHALKAVKELKGEHEARQELHQELSPKRDHAAEKYADGGEVPPYLAGNAETTQPTYYMDQLAKTIAPSAFGMTQPRGAASDEAPTEEVPAAMPMAQPMPSGGGGGRPEASEHLLNLRDQLQGYLDKQGGGNDNMRKLAETYKDQMASENNRPNMSGINALADLYWGSNLSKTFAPPKKGAEQTEAQMKAQEAVDKDTQPITSDLLKEYGQENNSKDKEIANYYKVLAGGQRTINGMLDTGVPDEMGQPIKLTKIQQPIAKDMRTAMFLGRGANQKVAQGINKLQSGVQFENMLAALPGGRVTPQDMAELISAEGQTVTGTNILTDHRFKELYPKSMELTADGIHQWFTGEPGGVEQKKWVNRLLNVVRSEKAGANKALGQWVDSQEKAYTIAGLPPAYVKATAKAAKEFYTKGYEPVAGVGGFTGLRAQPVQPETMERDGHTYDKVQGGWKKRK